MKNRDETARAGIPKKKILVVDDDPAIRKLLNFTFASSDFEVSEASNEQEFRNQAGQRRPDAIVLDIMLGDRDGVQIYQDLVRGGFDPQVPVVFLSVLAQDISPTPPRSGRTYALLAKPFDPEKLVSQIKSLL